MSRYQSRLLAFCRHMLASKEDAEDVLQEVFAAAFNAMLADERPINVRPWLYRIARNRSLNHLRKQTAIGVDSMDVMLSEHGQSTADRVHKREEFRQLLADVQDLPETQRTALLLREIDALSYDQIAEVMETTVPSVKSLLVRARVSLAEAAEARLLTCEEVREELGARRRGPGAHDAAGAPPPAHVRALPGLPQAPAQQQQGAGRRSSPSARCCWSRSSSWPTSGRPPRPARPVPPPARAARLPRAPVPPPAARCRPASPPSPPRPRRPRRRGDRHRRRGRGQPRPPPNRRPPPSRPTRLAAAPRPHAGRGRQSAPQPVTPAPAAAQAGTRTPSRETDARGRRRPRRPRRPRRRRSPPRRRPRRAPPTQPTPTPEATTQHEDSTTTLPSEATGTTEPDGGAGPTPSPAPTRPRPAAPTPTPTPRRAGADAAVGLTISFDDFLAVDMRVGRVVGGRRLPRGAQARLEADHRLRARARHQALVGADHQLHA